MYSPISSHQLSGAGIPASAVELGRALFPALATMFFLDLIW
jgi:hypothetical protein